MKIRLLTASILLGFANALPAGAVVESEEPANTAEFDALKAIGYAEETNRAVTHWPDGYESVKPIIATEDEGAGEFVSLEGDVELLAVLEGKVDEIGEELATKEYSQDELQRLLVLEARGKDRKGVLEPIAAMIEQG